jgi:hypothetical protein
MTRHVLIENAAFIERSPEDVYVFAATPASWPRWHPTATSVSGQVDRPVEVGDHVHETDRFAFLRGAIDWKVRRAEPGRGWAYDGVLSGVPLASGTTTNVSYLLVGIDGETRIERTMTYSIRGRAFGLLDAIYFERHNNHQSARALGQLKAILESRVSV